VRLSSKQLTSLLAAVFFVSGLTSLICQVAWQRLLTVNYGVGAVSITLIVSVYMSGLGLGSLVGGWLAERSRRPLALFAGIEGGLGIAGGASVPLILALGRLSAESSPAASFVCLFAFLLVPTLLMGITLPLLVTIFTRITRDFIYSVSHLYFVNTLGAAFGAVLTSYALVSLLGLDGCIYLAAAINVVLAAVILAASPKALQPAAQAERPDAKAEGSGGLRLTYALVLATGFVAIGYEIVWYRVIGVLVKDSPYAFSSVLAVYLLGIALGSRAIHRHLVRHPVANRRHLFCVLQFLIGLTVLITFVGYFYLSRYAPLQGLAHLSFSSDVHPSLALFARGRSSHLFEDAYLLLDVFLWPLAFLLVPTMLMGASFPLVSSLAFSPGGGAGRAVGTTYFFMVVGNVLGGLLTGLVLLPALGTELTVLAFGSIGLFFGFATGVPKGGRLSGIVRMVGVFLLLLGNVAVFPRPGALYAAMHVAPFEAGSARFEEGLDAVVLTYENGDRLRNFINGQGHGYRPGPLFLAEAIEGLSFASSPRSVLVIGFGAGSITEAALVPVEVQQVTVVELCGSAITNLRTFPVLAGILGDRKVRLVIDDGRRFLQRTDELFDVILMDPLRTTTAYSNNLHSRQFFELAGRHLAPGGILMVGGLSDCPVIPRTLLEEFGYVRAYTNFCLASRTPLGRNDDRYERLLRSVLPSTQASIQDFTRDFLEGQPLVEATAKYPVNQDWRPESEYYLGLELRRWLESR